MNTCRETRQRKTLKIINIIVSVAIKNYEQPAPSPEETIVWLPDTIKVSWDQLDSNQSGGTWVLTISVVPDKGIFGAEYSLNYMNEEFKKKIE
eukprot:9283480-Ditylum_brightwellii.AAC.1